MATYGIKIYSNDGQTEVYNFNGPTGYNSYKVTSTGLSGVQNIDGEPSTVTIYTYNGSGTFTGFSLSANANTATYSNGATISKSVTSSDYAELYIVDGTAVASVDYEHILLNGNKVQVDSAIRDGNGVKIDTNYAKKVNLTDGSVTKVGTGTVGGALKPMYLSSGVPTNGTQLYSKTITINGTAQNVIRSTNANIGNIFAPTSAGNSGQVVKSNGSGKAPTWVTLGAAASKAVATTLANNANLPTCAAVMTFVEGKGYTTNTGTVTQVKVGSTEYNPSSGVISLPAYPTVSYPVTSVNSKTGAVSLTASDVSALASNTTFATINGTSVKSSTAFTLQKPITISNSAPSGGSDGDIWIQYS